jgi:prepilin-type N-terminal cleavage/methylation domain-containing protein
MFRRIRHDQRSREGFTLLEMAIVVSLIGMIAAMSLPSMMKARKDSRLQVMVNDFRVIQDAMNMYAMDNGGFPTAYGSVPQPLANYLKNARWTKPTALGGRWQYFSVWHTYLLVIDDWNINRGQNPLAKSDDWLEVDRKIDDGDLTTGTFRLVSGMQVQYIIDEVNRFPQLPTS